MSRTFDVAVVGATGAVGEVMLEILAERKFLSLIHISEPTRRRDSSRMPSSA